MKTRLDKIGIAFLLMFFASLQAASAETMDLFRSDIVLKKDASVEVTETIVMDFGGENRHGIRRHIPVAYRRYNAPYSVGLEVQSVTDQNGQPINFESIHSGHDVNLKIGDASHTVQGKQTYKIHYLAKRVINWFGGEPEFYWNVTGNETPFPILKAQAVVNLPPGVTASDVHVDAFEGLSGSTIKAPFRKKNDQLFFSSSAKLTPDEGLTIVIRMPETAMKRPTAVDESVFWLKDWYPAILTPVISLLLLFARWNARGKDGGVTSVAGVDWEPPKGLTPSEVGTLVDEKCDVSDVTSTLVDLAVRGYLKIKKVSVKKFVFLSDKDYEITRLQEPANSPVLQYHEQRFLDGIFDSVVGSRNETGQTINASSLKYVFYPYFAEIKNLIYTRLVDAQLFYGNPEQIRTNFYSLSVLLAFIGCLAFIYSLPLALGFLISAVIAAMFAPAMPGRTAKGAELTRQALGFQRFVKMAEKDRIKVLAAEDPTIFGRLLPYAMVLGAADQWADAFKDLAIPCPDWYESDDYASSYTTSIFINDLGNSLGWFNQTLLTPPPSSTSSGWSDSNSAGSGFSGFDSGSSGGGFGGGGTDSW